MIFRLIVLLYLGASFYLAAKICRALKRRPRWVRITVWVVVLLLDFGYFTMRVLPDGCLTAKQVLYILSATWMAMVLYGSVVTLMLDIVRYFAMTHGQGKIYHTPRQMVVAGLATLLILGIGNINAKTPEVVHYEVDSDKLESGESLRIVLVSDLHLGFAIEGRREARLDNQQTEARRHVDSWGPDRRRHSARRRVGPGERYREHKESDGSVCSLGEP